MHLLPEKTTLEQVAEFHTIYDCPINNVVTICDESLNKLRVKTLREEVSELEEALANREAIEVLDALLDLQYFLDGTFLALGFHSVKSTAFAEVHRSNLSKLDEQGIPIRREDGKILKGPNFSPPNLQPFVDSLIPNLDNQD